MSDAAGSGWKMNLKYFSRENTIRWIIIAFSFGIFLWHASLFSDWIIDDAGISFVYARNLSAGYGLVSQPGLEPVEGYSNFLWVLLMTPFFMIERFDPIFTPKLISVILVFASFVVIQKMIRLIVSHSNIGTLFVLTFLAMNTAFVVWAVSGLENSLYTLLTLLILWKGLQLSTADINKEKLVVIAAFLSFLNALTRPDGVLYGIVIPVAIVANGFLAKRASKESAKLLGIYAGVILAAMTSFIVFRYSYFGDIFPNTYYAKGGLATWSLSRDLSMIVALFTSVAFQFSVAFLLLFVIYFLYKSLSRSLEIEHLILFVTLLISIIIYLSLPPDWMGEYRFATPFFPLFYMYTFLIGERITAKIKWRQRYTHAIFLTLTVIFAGISLSAFYTRSQSFKESPTVPFGYIAAEYGLRFNGYAEKLGIENGSFLLPDLGGTLYSSKLRIYDLAGLTDKVIARSLGKQQDVFYDYVFETIKPTFIHVHGWWTYRANFDADGRFRQDYVAINEYLDDSIYQTHGTQMYSGDYVRRDAIGDHLGDLTSLEIETP